MKKCCRGGHGRTGTIISIMIGILFNLNSIIIHDKYIKWFLWICNVGKEALEMNSRLHDQRIRTNGISSPETKCMSFFTPIEFFLNDWLI